MSKGKILIKMTGSIAAYKCCYLISRLVQDGFEVKVAASPSVFEFVGASTLEGLSQNSVASDLYEKGHAMDHIHLVRWADLVLVCPATANFINKISGGVGDDLLTTMFLAHDFKKPYLIAPAMNTAMYLHPITQKSISTLKELNTVKFLETASGVLACGETGWGRLLDPELIYREILSALQQTDVSQTAKPVTRKDAYSILLTAGGTREKIDSVRYITNTSTGQTGAQIAEHLIDLGFDVTYLHGKDAKRPDRDCKMKSFDSFSDLDDAIQTLLKEKKYRAVLHAAAVSDFSVEKIVQNGDQLQSDFKKLSSGAGLELHLKTNFKILDRIRSYAQTPLVLVGFKLTSGADESTKTKAVTKLMEQSGCDWVVQNDLEEINSGKHPFRLYGRKTSWRPVESVSQLAAELSTIFTEERITHDPRP